MIGHLISESRRSACKETADGSVVACNTTKNMSKPLENFGQASKECIIASEATKFAMVGGALISLITMGISGSVNDGILIEILTIHFIQPGSMMVMTNTDFAWRMIAPCQAVLCCRLSPFLCGVLRCPQKNHTQCLGDAIIWQNRSI